MHHGAPCEFRARISLFGKQGSLPLDEGRIWRPGRGLNPQPPERQSGYSTIELPGRIQSTVGCFFAVLTIELGHHLMTAGFEPASAP